MLLSKILKTHKRDDAQLFAVDADPEIWPTLEKNLAKHSCRAHVIKGIIGNQSLKLVSSLDGYGSITVPMEDPRPGKEIPAYSVESLNAPIDTLAIDCEGCFTDFLEQNPNLLKSLTMIVVEVHIASEARAVETLLKDGWSLKMKFNRQRILCKGFCQPHCDGHWLKANMDKLAKSWLNSA